VSYELDKGLIFTTLWLETVGFERKYWRLCLCGAFLDFEEEIYLRNILDCVYAFHSLLDKEYEIIIGRKGISVTLRIAFRKRDCYHLMGLQYIADRPELHKDRSRVFDEIMSDAISVKQVESSDFYSKIALRVDSFPSLEQLLDNNDTIFKYNQKANVYSMIDADYFMKNNIDSRDLYLFLSEGVDGKFFCRSFFPETRKDYTINQASWTLLYKKKINLVSGTEQILYDRLKK
jgi:hypothetical protein